MAISARYQIQLKAVYSSPSDDNTEKIHLPLCILLN